ncbi:MAG: YIP1 family protein [Acidimicrobiia bacterium]
MNSLYIRDGLGTAQRQETPIGDTGAMGIVEWCKYVVRAAMLDVDFYNQAEADKSLTWQAGIVVVLATGLNGIGSAIATESNVFAGAAVGALVGVVGWLIWSAIAVGIGVKVFKGTSDYGEMLRVIGFANAPLAIGVIPWLGFIGAVWSLLAAVVGIREGMDFTTKRAIATMIVGWLAWLLLAVAVQIVIGVDLKPSLPF